MNVDLKRDLFDYAEQRRGDLRIDEMLTGWLEGGASLPDRLERLRVWLGSFAAGHRSGDGEYLSTPEVAAFMVRLAREAVRKSEATILDPACGAGLLLAEAAMHFDSSAVQGIEINSNVAAICRSLLGPSGEVLLGDSIHDDLDLPPQVDVIISEPPFGARLRTSQPSPFNDKPITDLASALVCRWVQRLSPEGVAVFLLPAVCMAEREKRVWAGLGRIGYHLRAAIHVPSGILKATEMESYVVVLDRTERAEIFTAQLTRDEKLQEQILTHYQAHQRGRRPAQGRLTCLNSFRGFKAMAAQEALVQYAQRAGLAEVPIAELTESIDFYPDPSKVEVDGDQDVYLPVRGKCEAALSPDDLSVTRTGVIRMVINPEVADARFVAESFNDEIGRLFLDSVTTISATIRTLDRDALQRATFYLPARGVQAKVMEARSRIHALRAELDEIDAQLRRQPGGVDALITRVQRVNHEDTIEAWLDSLPFPLASILWRYRAGDGITKETNEILLHFFEALAEFWATVLLSAAKSDPAFWADHSGSLHAALSKHHLSFDHATFGLWICVAGTLRKRLEDLSKTDADRFGAMIASSSRDVMGMLLDSRLVQILQTANGIRNGKAHGGALGAAEIRRTHDELLDLVQTCRSVMGCTWERYELVQPGACKFSGGVWNYTVRRIMGVRTPFVAAQRKVVAGMEDRFLHLLDAEGDRSLALLPFVRIMPSPKTEENACYFYNRREPDVQRFVSYHFEAEAEVKEFSVDTQAALEALKPFGV
jgi:predicted RNA methylase